MNPPAGGFPYADSFFTGFSSSSFYVWYSLVFMLITAMIVYRRAEKGIERVSKAMMPVLLALVVIIALFSHPYS